MKLSSSTCIAHGDTRASGTARSHFLRKYDEYVISILLFTACLLVSVLVHANVFLLGQTRNDDSKTPRGRETAIDSCAKYREKGKGV